MQRFIIMDKKSHHAVMGVQPSDDFNWQPMDYLLQYRILAFLNGYQCKCEIEDKMHLVNNPFINMIAPEEAARFIADLLRKSQPDARLQQLLSHPEWRKSKQVELMKDFIYKPSDILWFCKLSQDFGYLLDVYRLETLPKEYQNMKLPAYIYEKDNGEIEKMGETDLSEGQMRDLLRKRKVYIIYIFHKGDIWHCFFSTYKAINGEEHGQIMGNQPHYHYISDKWGISRERMNECIQSGKLPGSIHIRLERAPIENNK